MKVHLIVVKLARGSAFLHNLLLKRYKRRMEVVREGRVITQPMAYDALDNRSSREAYKHYEDYTRYRTFELVADEIRRKYSPEELSRFCVAEAGVFKGDFSWIINEKFPECEMYLYDTFEGFDQKDLKDEVHRSFTEKERLKTHSGYFGNQAENSRQRIAAVKSKLKYKEKCHIRKGYFPDTAEKEKEKRWVFVSLDMDLYQPMKAGIFYFWPKMVEGGFMFIHDYNNRDFGGVKKAIAEAEEEFGRICKIPISDEGGTLILCK